MPIASEPDAAGRRLLLCVGRSTIADELVPALDDLGDHDFLVQHVRAEERDAVVFAGRDGLGTTFAVNWFLTEHVGVRWLMPGKLGEEISTREAVKLPVGFAVKQSPGFRSRALSGLGRFDGKRWLLARADEFQPNLWRLFPPSRYAQKFKHYYPHIDGKRQPPRADKEQGWQPCMSQGKVVETCARAAKGHFDRGERALTYSLGINLGGGFCQCRDCQHMDGEDAVPEENHTDRYVRFVNDVARRVAVDHPDRYLGLLALGATGPPPTETHADRNVLVYKAVEARDTMADVEAWAKRCEQWGVYQYLHGDGFVVFRHYPRALAAFVRRIRAMGARGWYAEAYPIWIIDGPKLWVLARLLWDRTEDVDRLLNEYFAAAYGPAAPEVRAFFDVWETAWARRPEQDRYTFIRGWRGGGQFDDLTHDDMRRMADHLRKAGELVETENQIARLELLRHAFEFARAHVAEQLAARELATVPPERAERTIALAEEVLEARRQRESLFHRAIRSGRTYLFPAHYKTADAYSRSSLSTEIYTRSISAIDAAFERVSTFLRQREGDRQAVAFWHRVRREHPHIGPHAESQIFLIENEGKLENLLISGGMEDGADGKPTGWTQWTRPRSCAKFAWNDESVFGGERSLAIGSARIGAWQQGVDVMPLGRYMCSVRVKTSLTRGRVALRVLWRGPSGWTGEPPIRADLPPDTEDWHELRTTLTIPEDATKAQVLLFVERLGGDDRVWFDNAVFARIR